MYKVNELVSVNQTYGEMKGKVGTIVSVDNRTGDHGTYQVYTVLVGAVSVEATAYDLRSMDQLYQDLLDINERRAEIEKQIAVLTALREAS